MKTKNALYANRRQALIEAMSDQSVVMISSGEEKIRNRDVEYAFRVNSDFYYLTGFEEPEAILVLVKNTQAPEHHSSYLFLRPKDVEQEIWQGRRLGVKAAANALGVTKAYSIDDFSEEMNDLTEGAETLYFSFAQLNDWSELVGEWIQAQQAKSRRGVVAPSQLKDVDVILHEMRLIKSVEEIDIMRQAAQISVKGHLAAMDFAAKSARQGVEYQLEAALEHCFKQQGSPRVAFNSIVAGGENACILHYTENSAALNEGELVLVDAGAEFQGYAGDITTTFPVNGRFSPAQKNLYQLTLKAQQAAISVIKPRTRYDEMHRASTRVIVEGLLELGILKGKVEALLSAEAFKPFFMHGTGHWLGMDVHDVGRYKLEGEWRPLEPGMVITVEPGIYISADVGKVHRVDPSYWGIGIRIEDDVLVTGEGHEVLTQGLPRTVEEIEDFMQNSQHQAGLSS